MDTLMSEVWRVQADKMRNLMYKHLRENKKLDPKDAHRLAVLLEAEKRCIFRGV